MMRMPQQMNDCRPLKTVELTPPDYRINPQYLIDGYVEMEVRYSGIIPNVPLSIDSRSRTEVLRVIDRGKREKYLQRNSQDAIFYLNAHNIKLLTRDSNEDLLLRLPIHEVAALSYVREDDSHILAITYGVNDSLRQQRRSVSVDDHVLSMIVVYCESRRRAEELCSLVDQCFQVVYTDATMRFFDHNLMEGAVSSVSVDYSFTDKSRESTPKSGSQIDTPTLGFLSHSSADLGTSSTATSRSSRVVTTDGEMSSAANQLILDYMKKLYNKLNAEELQRFAVLVKRWHSELSFADFIGSVLELYGPERTYLLVGMRPFIPAKDLSYFEHFIERNDLGESVHTLSSPVPTTSSWYRQSSLTDDSVDDFDMMNDIAGNGEQSTTNRL